MSIETIDICMNCTVKGDIDACLKTPCTQHNSWFAKTIIAKAEQDEPVSGFFSREAMKEHSDFHPQPRKPLTDKEIRAVYEDASSQSLRPQDYRIVLQFARAIEAAHDIKENT